MVPSSVHWQLIKGSLRRFWGGLCFCTPRFNHCPSPFTCSMKRAKQIWTRIFVSISRWLAEEWEKEVLRIGTVKSVTYHRKCSGTLCKLLHIFSWFRKLDHLPISCSELRQFKWIIFKSVSVVPEGSRGQGFKGSSEMLGKERVQGVKDSRFQVKC